MPGASAYRSARPVALPSPALAQADGVLSEGMTLFDDEYEGVVNLDPGLLRACAKQP